MYRRNYKTFDFCPRTATFRIVSDWRSQLYLYVKNRKCKITSFIVKLCKKKNKINGVALYYF